MFKRFWTIINNKLNPVSSIIVVWRFVITLRSKVFIDLLQVQCLNVYFINTQIICRPTWVCFLYLFLLIYVLFLWFKNYWTLLAFFILLRKKEIYVYRFNQVVSWVKWGFKDMALKVVLINFAKYFYFPRDDETNEIPFFYKYSSPFNVAAPLILRTIKKGPHR